jgi:hypothetical protein
MPSFYLKLRGGLVSFPNDPDPEQFPNLDAARAGAIESIREMASQSVRSGRHLNVDAIDITTEDGNVLATVPVSGVVVNGKSYPPLT